MITLSDPDRARAGQGAYPITPDAFEQQRFQSAKSNLKRESPAQTVRALPRLPVLAISARRGGRVGGPGRFMRALEQSPHANHPFPSGWIAPDVRRR